MNAPHCYVYVYVAYLVLSVFAVIEAYGNFLRANVVFIFERFFWLVLLVVLVLICKQN